MTVIPGWSKGPYLMGAIAPLGFASRPGMTTSVDRVQLASQLADIPQGLLDHLALL